MQPHKLAPKAARNVMQSICVLRHHEVAFSAQPEAVLPKSVEGENVFLAMFVLCWKSLFLWAGDQQHQGQLVRCHQTNDAGTVTPEGKPAAETSVSEVNFGSNRHLTKLYQKLEREG